MLKHLDVPESLQRNHPNVAAAGYEHTGETLINLVMHRVGLQSLADVDVLDVGCGVRFAATIINRSIPVKSYTGVEVERSIVDFLNRHVAAHDERFRFVHWDVQNDMYNPKGTQLSTLTTLPLAGDFDLIWLFSVFTHLGPTDARAMLRILRRHIRKEGRLFFSAFIDDNLEGFQDRDREKPLRNAYYGRKYMESLIVQTGWSIEGAFEKDLRKYIQHYYVCSPAAIDGP